MLTAGLGYQSAEISMSLELHLGKLAGFSASGSQCNWDNFGTIRGGVFVRPDFNPGAECTIFEVDSSSCLCPWSCFLRALRWFPMWCLRLLAVVQFGISVTVQSVFR